MEQTPGPQRLIWMDRRVHLIWGSGRFSAGQLSSGPRLRMRKLASGDGLTGDQPQRTKVRACRIGRPVPVTPDRVFLLSFSLSFYTSACHSRNSCATLKVSGLVAEITLEVSLDTGQSLQQATPKRTWLAGPRVLCKCPERSATDQQGAREGRD